MKSDVERLKEVLDAIRNPTRKTRPTYEEVALYMSARDPEIEIKSESYVSEGVSLDVDVYLPNKIFFPGKRPGIMFFFGGGFTTGCKEAFSLQAEALARQGYVALCPAYRTKGSHGVTSDVCVRDGIAAWRYMNDQADRWDLDTDRLALSGGSAGGLIAQLCGPLSGKLPNALVLYNPALLTMEKEGSALRDLEFEGRSVRALDLPDSTMPPTLILSGEEDGLIQKSIIQAYVERAKKQGVDCRLILYPKMNHGFFNYNSSRPHYYLTTGEAMLFLNEIFAD